ncbi:MAG TPA: fumarylacetoacetate hydrolase family protein [Chloroflexota bacterium]|nr:fumarylacetoacetate hydrolase family protein [Chloroflexota bacterium]
MAGYRLLSYRAGTAVRAGILVDETVIDMSAALGGSESVLDVLRTWEQLNPLLARAAAEFRAGKLKLDVPDVQPLGQVKLEAPIHFPGAIFGASANYLDPQGRMRGGDPPDKTKNRPSFFMKASWEGAVIGPGDAIRPPRPGAPVGFEIELGVVIGPPARHVRAAEAMGHVAGYVIMNDLGDMTPGRNNDIYQQWFGNNWFRTKCFDTCAPMGPWITPAEDVPDPNNLRMQLWVNGDPQQDICTSQMLFNIPELIETISDQLTLRPGDVISTGTYVRVGPQGPEGVRLKPGDVMQMSIEGLGTMTNPVEEAV